MSTEQNKARDSTLPSKLNLYWHTPNRCRMRKIEVLARVSAFSKVIRVCLIMLDSFQFVFNS